MARLPYLNQADLAPENKDLLNRVGLSGPSIR